MARNPADMTAPELAPAGTTADADGIVVGTGPARVDIYIDFLCPFCRQFEAASGSVLESIAATGVAAIVYHPVAFLDRLSTTRYSSRAAAASGCAADRDAFMQYKDALFASQPQEGGPGLSDEELARVGLSLGLDQSFARCVGEGRYVEWSSYVTARAIERGVAGTPTVFVNGVPVPANARAIAGAIHSLAAGP